MECNRRKDRWQNGGITVFTAVVLAAIFFLNGVLLDWAAVLTAKELSLIHISSRIRDGGL